MMIVIATTPSEMLTRENKITQEAAYFGGVEDTFDNTERSHPKRVADGNGSGLVDLTLRSAVERQDRPVREIELDDNNKREEETRIITTNTTTKLDSSTNGQTMATNMTINETESPLYSDEEQQNFSQLSTTASSSYHDGIEVNNSDDQNDNDTIITSTDSPQQPIVRQQTSIKYQLVKTTTTCYSPSITTVATRRLAIVFAIALSSYCIMSAAKLGYCAPVTSTTTSTKTTPITKNVISNGQDVTASIMSTKFPLSLPSTLNLETRDKSTTNQQLDLPNKSADEIANTSQNDGINNEDDDDSNNNNNNNDDVDADHQVFSKLPGDFAAPLTGDDTIVLVLANKLPLPASPIR